MANQIHGKHEAGTHLLRKLPELSSKHPIAKPYIDRMMNNSSPLVAKTLALADMAGTPNPLYTADGNFERLFKKVEVYGKDGTAALNANSYEREEGAKALNALADARLKLNVKSENHSAFMLRFANMSKSEIWREAVTAMKNGDSEFMATVLKAHPFLSGLSAEDMQRLRSDYVKVQAPDISGALEALDEAFNTVLAIDRVTQSVKTALSDPRRYEEIRQGVDAAERAEAAFNAPPPPVSE
ncbi:hypothetical protein [Hyphomonas sp.]|uniref:hypothetical protein n=1 Tax=Hyphomonas sp. TaxID=87 RepID=UPI00391AF5EB